MPSQGKFHACGARFKGYSGPIGSGKSQALCQEAIRLGYINSGRTGLIGAPTYPMLRDATLSSLFAVLHANEIPFEHNKSENVMLLTETNSKILLRSVDEYDRLRGTNLAWFGIDELTYTVEEAWLRLEGRLRDPYAKQLCGYAVWTPKGHDWVFRRFLAGNTSAYDVTVARAFENHHILDKIPDYYERLKNTYGEGFYRQEVMGEYLATGSNRVYDAFVLETHVGEVGIDSRLPLLWALDFNVDPMSSIVAQRQGDMFVVLDEIVLNRATTYQACEEFWNRFRHHPAGVVVYGDASGQNLKTTGTTDYQIIRQFFARTPYRYADYRVPKSNPAVRDRVQLVNSKLKSAAGDARMRIASRCKELTKDLEQVTYKPESTVIDKEKDLKRTHLSDALGYLIWQECRSGVRFGEQTTRLL